MSEKESKNSIQVIERMMRLLDVLAESPDAVSLKVASGKAELHPSTAHRILTALVRDRMVERVEQGSDRLGMRLLELGNLVKSRISVREHALPFMREHSGETVCVKYGGHAMGDDKVAERLARDIVLLKQVGINPIVVHGGGPQIGAMLDRLKIKSEFIDGLRVTDAATVEIVEMVLSGSINKQIVSAINKAGGFAVGMSGKDGNLIKARKLRRSKKDPGSNIEKILDLGFVGEPSEVMEPFRNVV